MDVTRKEFLELTGGALAVAAARPAFAFLTPPVLAQDVLDSDVVRKTHGYIADHKEEHIAKVQADLRQPHDMAAQRRLEPSI